MKVYHIVVCLALAAGLAACVREENPDLSASGAVELKGIAAQIQNGVQTRAGAVTALEDYVGRSDFKGGDRVVFTEIRRTQTPIESFTYPGTGNYEGIIYDALSEGGWVRNVGAGEPERIYWTDAQSVHTFIAYGCPQVSGFDWKKFTVNSQQGQRTYYIGSLGDPTQTGTDDVIDYTLTAEEQETYHKTANNQEVYSNPKLENEDLVIAYNTQMQAEPGGSVAMVKFHHALSSIRVVVNIIGFSSSSTAVDNEAVVSDMRLLHQPTMYIWMQASAGAQPVTSQDFVNTAWSGAATIPGCDQRKDIKLWIPHPEGTGHDQSKIFTFYGITTPQPYDTYLVNFEDTDIRKKVELSFKVTYPDPMNPTKKKTSTYTASLADVSFLAGYNTTINISLNHRNEKMTVGAEYENWQYVATPDVSELMKNSTFLQDTEKVNENRTITIAEEEAATKDDATWLYKMGTSLYDIYGHTGDSEEQAYQISTAYQLLSFAYEVKSGRTFEGKYIRLDADITLQPSAETEEAGTLIDWIGIGDSTHPFQGTFLGGNRFIYRLKGTPLFVNVGEHAHIQELKVTSQSMAEQDKFAVAGHGLIAETNAGTLSACIASGDVTLSTTDSGAYGALVGTNSGTIYACYHIGETKCPETTGTTVGGLVGTSSGTVAHCFQAGNVTHATGVTTGGVVGANTGTLTTNFYNRTLLSPTYEPESGVKGKVTAEMTLPAFVMALNAGIQGWSYVFRPANYPVLGTYTAADGWLETDFDQLVSGDVFVLVGNNGSDYAMSNNNGPEASPAAVPVTIKNGAVSGTVPSNLQWTVTKDGGNYSFSPFGDNTVALYAMGGNSNWINVREPGGSDSKQVFVMDDGYLKCVAAGPRYLGIFDSTDWRAYTSHTKKGDNIYGQVFKFYKWYDNDGKSAGVTLTHQGTVAYGTASTTLALSNPHGLSVTLESSDPTVATVAAGPVTETSADIPVTILKAGTTSITASWSKTTIGEVEYPAGSYQYVLKVWKGTPSISFENTAYSVDVTDADPTVIPATITPGSLSVTYSSSNTSVATVDAETGAVRGVMAGTAVITATFAGNDEYESVKATYNLTVTDSNPYAITLVQPSGNYSGFEISADPGSPQTAGTVITLACTGSVTGYIFKEWDVYKTGEEGTKTTVTDNKFTMPAYPVTVAAVFRGGGSGVVTDVLNRAFTGVSGTNYTEWSGKYDQSIAVYAGNSAGGNNSIQLKSKDSNSGIVATQSGGYARIITVDWNTNTSNGATLNVYGKNTAYTAASELYNASTDGDLLGTIVKGTSTQFVIPGEYTFIGLCSNSGAMYLNEVDIQWSSVPPVTRSLTIGSAEHGSVTSNAIDPSAVWPGTTVTLTIAPEDGYTFNGLTVDNSDVTASVENNQYVFTMPDHDVSVTASFQAKANSAVTITALSSALVTDGCSYSVSVGGSAIADGASVQEGQTVTLSATDGSTYSFYSWSVYKTGDNTTVVPVTSNSFTMPAYAVTVEAHFVQWELDGIAVTTPPTKTVYTEGQCFNPSGMVVTATYKDHANPSVTKQEVVPNGNLTFTPGTTTPLTTSDASITITYGGKSTTQGITVNESGSTTTAYLTQSEITANITNTACAYGTEKTYADSEDGVTWVASCYTDAANRPWMQLKNDANAYIKIVSSTDIQSVKLTITNASNSSGGVADISKHGAYEGQVNLATAASGGTNVATANGSSISENQITLTPSGSNTTLYIKVSAGARIWGIEVVH